MNYLVQRHVMTSFMGSAERVGWRVLSVTGGTATDIAHFDAEDLARRTAQLLDRHGLVDASLTEVDL